MGRRGGYASRPTQDDPMVVIPNPIYARIVIAAEEMHCTPGEWVEHILREGLKTHGAGMEDAAFEAACREADRKRTFAPMRHEFDKGRGPRMTDPR